MPLHPLRPGPRVTILRTLVLTLLAVATLLPSNATARQADDPPPPPATGGSADDPGALTTSEQTVEVGSLTDDEAIRDRLLGILEATGRFDDPAVDVRDGVVFLAGRTDDVSNREWAGSLARRTEGVVAVVNDIALTEGPLWTLDPAVREMRTLWRQVIQAAPLVVLGLIVLIIAIFGARIVVVVIMRPLRRRVQSDLVRGVIEKVLLLVVILIGFYLFLRISGLTRVAVTVAGGTGIVGLVLGFAFRDIAENFLASILISVQRPFRLGDTIEVAGHTGIVQKVTTRGTVLMDFDGNHIQIPNATVYKSTIRNFTANPKIRIGFVIGVGYDSSIARAQDLAYDVLRAHSAVLNDPEPVVLVEEFGAATIKLRVHFWIDGNTHSNLKVKSSLMRQTLRAYEAAGISLPDEAREVIFPNAVPVRMLPADDGAPMAAPHGRSDAPEHGDVEVIEAEGNLRSEASDIQEQARSSRDPDGGADILAAEGEPGAEPAR